MAAKPIKTKTNTDEENRELNTHLRWAAATNRVEAEGADVNAVDKYSNTALHWATRNNSKETAAELIKRGANVNALNKEGNTPLHWAAINNSKETAAELIQRGANVNALNKEGNTPLHWATRNNSKETAAELIQNGANVNALNKEGNTPLYWATRNNSKNTAADLIQRGADVNAVNKEGNTPLHWATINNSKKTTAELIVHGADVNAVDKYGNTALHWATRNNSKETAVELIKHGADINAVNKEGISPLHWTTLYNSQEIAVELIHRGADVNAVNNEGITPLHWATLYNSQEIAAELIQHEANVNAVDEEGNTPLHWASKNNSKDTAAELIQRGADVNAVDKEGNTPLHWTIKNNSKETATELLDFNADIFIKNMLGSTPLTNAFSQTDKDIFLKICQKIQCNPLSLNCNREPYFHAAVKFCFNEILDIPDSCYYSREFILQSRDFNGNSSLHFWATAHLECTHRIKEFGERLIELGVQLNARNNEDQTPLHVATSWTAVDVLLEKEVWRNVKSEPNGDTPLITRAKSIEKSSSNFYDGFCSETKPGRSEDILIQEWQKVSENGMDLWITNYSGESVLKLLIERNNFVLANALVTFQTSTSAADLKHTNGDTILHITCVEAKDELQTTIDNLLKSGVKVNCLNATKQSPLHLVCKRICNIKGDKQNVVSTMLYWTVSRLLAYGADPTLKDCSGVSCYDIAQDVPELSKLLKKPIDISSISQLLQWSDPKSKNHRHAIAQVVRNQNSMQFESFHFHKTPIGSGSFGHVFAGVNIRDGREIAVKRIEKQRLTLPHDKREISNLTRIQDCGEIVRYHCNHEDNYFVFLILDLMEGTLIDYLSSEEKDTSKNVELCRDVINGLSFLHQKNVLHRDIKPGNILYKLHPRICLKLADFGLSSKASASSTFSVMHTAAGTRCWMAPELLRSVGEIKHSEESDVFACGLVLHFLLAEMQHPFTNPLSIALGSLAEQSETEQAILKYELFLHKDLTPEARDLLQAILSKNESERPTAASTLYHPFFWSEEKRKNFVMAVGNQPEIQRPRSMMATTLSSVEQELENTLGKRPEVSIGWESSVLYVYSDMTTSGRRYDTSSAVELVRFVRNCYAHASDRNRTPQVQQLILKDHELFEKFSTLVIDVYRAVVTHGWNNRVEIKNVLKSK